MRGACQEVSNTKSRRSGPRKWRGAVVWLIAAGLHPRANATTQRVAEDLADRMDFDTGHVRYCEADMVARTGISRANLYRHIGYLRELGALAYVEHGSRRNIRAAMGLKGYAGTATVYAAVIPAVYDHAKGHTIVGSGYNARIIIDQRNQPQDPVDTSGNQPVDNSSTEELETPSLCLVKEESQVQLVGGFNYTSQARPPKNPIPQQSTSINGRRRTASDVRKAANETRLVRALVNWTQLVPLRKLEHALRPWTDRGWDALRIADELNGMCSGVRWRPKNPAAFIRAQIAKATAHEETLAQAVAWENSTAYREMADRASLAELFAPAAPEPKHEYTAEEKARARMDWNNWPDVLDHLEEDELDAVALYGKPLVDFAIEQGARQRRSDHAYI